MILSSDISQHFKNLSAFKAGMQKKKFPEDTMDDTQLILNMCLYASDHCNPTKAPIPYFKWMALEMEEYYQQGDIEKKLGYEVSPFFDRTSSNPFQFQLGYIEVICEPMITTWTEFLPQACKSTLIKGLEENKRLINQKISETKALGNMDGGGQQEANGSDDNE